MTLRLGGDGVITGCTSLGEPTINISGLTVITPIEAISGTAAAPSYTFSGDTDNGLYYAGTNSIGVSTAGTAALTIDSSQQVGIGTASPSKKLEISASSAEAGIALSSSGRTLVMTSHEQGGVSQATKIGTTSNHELRIITNDTERMRISSTGNVGIGESDPDHLLVLKSTGDARLHIQADSDNIGEDDNPRISFSQDGSDEFWKFEIGLEGTNGQTFSGSLSNCPIFSAAVGNINQPFIFGHNGEAVMAIKNNSLTVSEPRVGIGTMTPAGALDVSPSSGRFIVDDSGNVGIGQASPAAPIDVTTANGRFLVHEDQSDLCLDSVTTGNTAFETLRIRGTNLLFQNGSDERARIDSSGRLLVGTPTSVFTGTGTAAQMQINGVVGLSVRRNSADEFGANITLGKSRNATDGSYTILNNNDEIGSVRFAADDGTDLKTQAALIKAEVDGTPGANDMPGRLVFSTTADGASSPTERMRINAAGNITGAILSGNSNIFVARHQSSGSGSGPFFYLGYSSATDFSDGTYRYSVGSNGDVKNSNNSYTAISDIKLKENITDANSQWSDIKSLQIRNYNFKEETGQDTHTQIGLIAQELELTSPGLVTNSPDLDSEGNDLGTVTKSVNYSVLYMKSVKALQEAMERIETLEIEVAALKNK